MEETFAMKDSEARGLVLQRLYNFRDQRDGGWLQPSDFSGVPVSEDALPRLVEYLVQENLADWKPVQSGSRMGVEHFIARITSAGVNVAEGTSKAPPSIIIDYSINVQGSQGVQIGGRNNVQTVTMDIDKLMIAVDSSGASITEREEAKSLLKKIADNKLVQMVIGNWFRNTRGP
jgi:hypothetical protein